MPIEVNSQVFENQRRILQALTVVNSEMSQRLRESIFNELKKVRDNISSSIHFKNGDPRGTAKAVKRYIARKYMGGVVSILSSRQASGVRNTYEEPRKLRPGQRGGNRMLRSPRTESILGLAPQDRGFILRMVNSGTHPRYANGRNGKWKNGNNRTFFKLQEDGTYYRGSISPRNFFAQEGHRQMEAAVQNLSKMIDEEFQKLFNEQ